MVAREQPAKLAAFEGQYQTGRGDLTLFGIPSESARRVLYAPKIPGGLGFLVHRDPSAPVLGLDRIRPADRPPVLIPYAGFHLMVVLGVAFVGLTLVASYFRWRKTLFRKPWLLSVFVFAVAGPFIANEAGWIAAEVGRQPWVVNPRVVRNDGGQPLFDADGFLQYRREEGLLTSAGVSPALRRGEVIGSLVAFSLVYVLLFAVWITILDREIKAGPRPIPPPARTTLHGIRETASSRALHEESMTESERGRS